MALFELCGEFEPIHAGHLEVGEDGVVEVGVVFFEGVLAIGGGIDGAADELQQHGDGFPAGGIIVYEEDSHHGNFWLGIRRMEDSHRWGCPDHGCEYSFTCAILGFVS